MKWGEQDSDELLEDGGGNEPPEVLGNGCDTTEDVPPVEKACVTKYDGMALDMVGATGSWTANESTGGPTWSSAPSSSVLMMLSTCVVDWEEDLLGSKA